jgi:hypothetical protein
VGSKAVFSRGEGRLRMGFVVPMTLGDNLTKRYGPSIVDMRKDWI